MKIKIDCDERYPDFAFCVCDSEYRYGVEVSEEWYLKAIEVYKAYEELQYELDIIWRK